jgi:hypothetical protein
VDIKELEQQGLIESFAATLQEIDDLLEVARRDLTAARHMLPFDSDWSLAIAYNAALQAVLALMYAYDYRPRGPICTGRPWILRPWSWTSVSVERSAGSTDCDANAIGHSITRLALYRSLRQKTAYPSLSDLSRISNR